MTLHPVMQYKNRKEVLSSLIKI